MIPRSMMRAFPTDFQVIHDPQLDVRDVSVLSNNTSRYVSLNLRK